jgi:chromosome segregation ATPase
MRKVSPEKQRAIIEAADQLVQNGTNNPTNDDVRAALGGGSIADISPVMRQWREDRKKMVGVQLTMPEAVGKAGERFIAQLWAAADAESSKAIEAVKEEAVQRVSAVEGERDEALREITQLEEQLATLRRDLEARDRELQQQRAEMAMLEKSLQAVTVEREKATARADAAQESQDQIIAQLKDAQASNKELQNELIKLARATSPNPPGNI